MFFAVIGLAIGLGLPIQTVINSRLRAVVRSPYLASFISFLVGTVFLGLITWSVNSHLFISLRLIASQQPWWLWSGGLLGVERKPIVPVQILGLITMIAGVVLIKLF